MSVGSSTLNVGHSAPRGAVFLSYARDDLAAARRIADALAAFGVEVWFDQDELAGGDAWDAKIRDQVRRCALFIAVVSAATQARGEGYFRREWKLAAERTHDMAAGVPFLMPVAIDDTPEAGALVPEEFTRVQWTRLPRGVPSPQFVAQVQRLLAPTPGRPAAVGAGPAAAGRRALPRRTLVPAVAVALALVLAAAAWIFFGRSHGDSGPARPPVVVLMDSTYVDRVYDPVTLKSGGSNADDITDILRDLPVTLVKEATSATWRREAEIVKDRPALIVIHRSAFYTFPAAMSAELYPLADNKLVAFFGYVATHCPETKFIVYSRHSWEAVGEAAKWRDDAANRFPQLAGKIETWRVPLDRASFRHPLTAQELRTSVERALGFKSGPAAAR
jgi:hypothetical protein